MWHLFKIGCVSNVPAGGGDTGSPTPSPSTISSAAMTTMEEEGLHLRPSSSHCGCSRDRRMMHNGDVLNLSFSPFDDILAGTLLEHHNRFRQDDRISRDEALYSGSLQQAGFSCQMLLRRLLGCHPSAPPT